MTAELEPETRRTIVLESRKSLELSLGDLLVDGKLSVYPHVEDKGLLFIQFRRGRAILSAGAYVGLIPLSPNLTVDVRPKLPVSNLARLLDSSRTSLGKIDGAERLYLTGSFESNSVLEFLAVNLLEAMQPLNVQGLWKGYVSIDEITSQPKGRIEMLGTMRERAYGRYHKVVARRYEQSADSAINRVIKSALRAVIVRLKDGSALSKRLITELNRSFVEMPSSISEMRATDVQEVRRVLQPGGLPPLRTYYRRALEIASLIVTQRGISLQQAGLDVALETFIVNFDTLFEDYVRSSLRALAPEQIEVKDGNKEGRKPLFDEGGEPFAQPDFLIESRLSGKLIVGEVKYKERPNRDDINQVITYASSFRSQHGVLVHQRGSNDPPGIRKIGTIGNVQLDGYAIDLARDDLEDEERQFAAAMFGLLS